MTPDGLRGVLEQLLGEHARCTSAYGEVAVEVPRGHWVAAVTAVRDDAATSCRFFDVLTAVDELELGFEVMVRLWSQQHRHAVQVRTRCPRDDAQVPTLSGVFAGAAWHERHVWEMFGITFDGHPRLVPLLLPDNFAGAPLRKDFVLASRVEKDWPGAKEPTRSGGGAP